MLIEFSVENFLSFRERATLSMVAAKDDSLPENVIQLPNESDVNLLKSAAIYGANASGKSNLIDAIRFMSGFVRSSSEYNGNLPARIIPFKLDAAMVSKPSTFEIVFFWKGERYVYGFSMDANCVYHEWLFNYEKRKGRMLFERVQKSKESKPQFKFSIHWKGEKKRLAKRVRPQALFLSVAAQFNNEIADNIMSWFHEGPTFISWNPAKEIDFFETCRIIQKEDQKKKAAVAFLNQADFGVTDFFIERVSGRSSSDDARLPGEYNVIAKDIKEATKSLNKALNKLLKVSRKHREAWEASLSKVITIHRGRNNSNHIITIPFEFTEESDGTQKVFSLSGIWLDALKNGATVVADELDVRLHPLLTKWLIQTFHNEKINRNGAQLIFTTHDASLLDKALLRRDQVWFTEKNIDGASSLYSLWDFKEGRPRKEENMQKGYLAGRYGAIPILEDWADDK